MTTSIYTDVSIVDAPWIAYDEQLGPQLRETPSLALTYLGVDTTSPPFDDLRVRQALGAAVDWRRVAALASFGGQVPATSMVPAAIPGAGDKDWLPLHDPDRARALLAEAGYPGGVGLPRIEFAVGGAPIADAIAADLERELGIDVELVTFDDHLGRISTDPPNLWISGWIADFPGPNDFLGVLLESDSSENKGGWVSPAFDQAIADALATRDPAAAEAAFERALTEIQRRGAGRAAVRQHGLVAVAGGAARRRRERHGHPAHGGHGVGANEPRRARRSGRRCSSAVALLPGAVLAGEQATPHDLRRGDGGRPRSASRSDSSRRRTSTDAARASRGGGPRRRRGSHVPGRDPAAGGRRIDAVATPTRRRSAACTRTPASSSASG